MNWRLKVGGAKALSWMPGGPALYRFSQKHITRSLLPTQTRVRQKIEVGRQYLRWLTDHGAEGKLLTGTHLDYGAGWHPTIPLLYYSLGVQRQILLDIAPLLDRKLLAQTVETFRSVTTGAEATGPQLARLPPPLVEADWRHYLSGLGMTYHAPYLTALDSITGTADVATSTQVFPYVPGSAIPTCFKHVWQCLKPGGFFLATMHLREMQAGWDQFRFPTADWERWFNSALLCYSQLRASDYRALLEQAGFELISFEVEPGTANELKELEEIKLAPQFQGYSPEELAARHLFFAAKKR